MRVFIVDDHRIVRQRLVAMLEKVVGTEVVGEAETVTAARARISELHPDLVILDFRLPDGDGIDVLHHLKTLPTPPLVVMLTNYADDQLRHRSVMAGADFFLDKSKQFDEIPGLIEELTHTRTNDHA
jgi:DNA-binding NarL/FixJ family response regulator